MKVNMLEAKNQLSRLVKDALAGEDIVIASNGEPMVRLVPVARGFNSRPGHQISGSRWGGRSCRLPVHAVNRAARLFCPPTSVNRKSRP